MDRRTRLAECVMALAIIALSAAFLWDGWNLRPGVLEPVGSGTVPNSVAWIAIALSAMALTGIGRSRTEGDAAPEGWGTTAISAALLVAYVAALGWGLRYSWVTLAYVFLAILAIAPGGRRAWAPALLAGAAMGFGLDYTFRHLLVTDLP